MRASVLAGILAGLAALPALAGCVDSLGVGGTATSDDVGGPGFHIRRTDFYHSYRAVDETWTDTFDWNCPEGKAKMEVRHSMASGVQKIVLKDANGATVFTQDFSRGSREGEYGVGSGAPGAWTIEIVRQDASGQLDLHVWRDVASAPPTSA